jgi:hypothetical protein
MAINSLYDKNRRRKLLQDVEKGRYEPRKRPQDAAAGPAETILPSVAAAEAEVDERAATARMPVPPIPSQSSLPGRQHGRSAFPKIEPLVEGPMGGNASLAGPNSPQKILNSALFEAIKKNDFAAVKDFIEQGADVNAVEIEDGLIHRAGTEPLDTVMFTWTNPLSYAEKLGCKEIEKLLIAHGARREIDLTRASAKCDDGSASKNG